MGYNSAIMICNDVMSVIDKDPKGWWECARNAIFNLGHKKDGVFGHGNSANGFQAISCEHADTTVIVAIGGNSATVLGRYWNGGCHHDEKDKENLLRMLAADMGYTLRKKPAK